MLLGRSSVLSVVKFKPEHFSIGGNIFKATMEYLTELVNSTQGQLEITVAVNGFYPCAQEQKDALQAYIKAFKLSIVDFDLVKDKGEMAMRTVDDVLRGGNGTAELNPSQPSI
jgi:hypothetical protein